jgi:hypothetical protein
MRDHVCATDGFFIVEFLIIDAEYRINSKGAHLMLFHPSAASSKTDQLINTEKKESATIGRWY